MVSSDLREFAANLRAAGCPPETVCDVIRPESKRALRARTERAQFHTNFWMAGTQRAAHDREVRKQVWHWEQEQLDMFTELDCRELWPDQVREGDAARLVALVAGFMPRERQLALLDVVANLQRVRERWREETEGVVLPADLKWLEEESGRMIERIRVEVGPAEIEEVCLRVASGLSGGSDADEALAAIAVTPTEFRELYHRAYLAGENDAEREFRLERLLDLDGYERPRRTESQRWADDREVLGAARATELHLRTGPSYSTVRAWVDQYGLDPSTPTVVFERIVGLRQDAALISSMGREPGSLKESFLEAYTHAQVRLEESLSRVPATNRTELIREWLQQAAREGWESP